MVVRYYILPQDTHLGRQPHHAAREVFLGTQVGSMLCQHVVIVPYLCSPVHMWVAAVSHAMHVSTLCCSSLQPKDTKPCLLGLPMCTGADREVHGVTRTMHTVIKPVMCVCVCMFACTLLQDFVEPTCAVLGKAYVHTPAEFAAAPESEGNDVFVCDYEYDEAWKRFRKRRYDDAAADDVGTNTAYPQTPAGRLHAYA